VYGTVNTGSGSIILLHTLIESDQVPVILGNGIFTAGAVRVIGGGSGIAGTVTQVPLNSIDT
jgi:hypothetical protein